MGKIIRTTLEEILATPLTAQQKADLEKLRNIRDEDIDFSENPDATDEDIASGRVRLVAHGGRRVGAGRKPRGTKPVTLWLKPETIERMRHAAKKEKISQSDAVEKHLVWD